MILPGKRKDLNDPPFEMIKCMKVKVSEELKHSHSMKVSKVAKIRKRYNQVPHLTQEASFTRGY